MIRSARYIRKNKHTSVGQGKNAKQQRRKKTYGYKTVGNNEIILHRVSLADNSVGCVYT